MLHRFASSLMRGVSGDDPAGGAGSGVLRRRREPLLREVRDPACRAYGSAQASRWSAPVPLPETAAWVPSRKSPRWSAERASRLQRDGPRIANADRRASHARHRRRVRLSALHPPLVRGRCKHEDTTRKPQGAAETKGEAMERAGTKAGVDESMTSSAPRASLGAAAQ